MLFSWWARQRRRKILAEPFPAAWLPVLADVGHYQLLPRPAQERVRAIVQILLAEKDWEGCRGLAMTDEARVTIAVFAAILVLGMPDFYFDSVQSVLVYPDDFRAPRDMPMGGDVALHDEVDLLGEAHPQGTVILSWPPIRAAADDPGRGENLVFHEFAHQLDATNGEIDGVPQLERPLRRRWSEVMERHYELLRRTARRGGGSVLDPYGATEPAEFFAVATEAFFDAPLALRGEHPQLYALLSDYYRQDPAEWSWSRRAGRR